MEKAGSCALNAGWLETVCCVRGGAWAATSKGRMGKLPSPPVAVGALIALRGVRLLSTARLAETRFAGPRAGFLTTDKERTGAVIVAGFVDGRAANCGWAFIVGFRAGFLTTDFFKTGFLMAPVAGMLGLFLAAATTRFLTIEAAPVLSAFTKETSFERRFLLEAPLFGRLGAGCADALCAMGELL